MATVFLDADSVQIPEWVRDLTTFRRWVHSDEFPEKRRICYLDSEVWVDMSREEFFSHNQVKNEFNIVLAGLIRAGKMGHFVPDGMLVSNVEADVSSQPDGTFVSYDALDTGRVRLIEGKHGGFTELEGTPDMVLEVVSESSVTKDTVTLKKEYWEAGIAEYWLADARGERLSFTLFRHTPKGYVSVKKQGGWLRSSVFGKSFRLTRSTNQRGDPECTLEVR